MECITINYSEAATLTGIKKVEAKELFQKALNQKTVAIDEEVDLFRLDVCANNLRSFDPQYDDQGFFTVHANLAKANYRKYLSHKSFVKQGELPGGATVFLKICTPAQLDHINRLLVHYGHKVVGVKGF